MALRKLSHIEDDAVEWLREKYEKLRHSLIVARVGSIKNPYNIISEGNREKELKLGRMYFFHYQPKTRMKFSWKNVFLLL